MQSSKTLTPALSLSERERVNLSPPLVESPFGDRSEHVRILLPRPVGRGEGWGGYVQLSYGLVPETLFSLSCCALPGESDFGGPALLVRRQHSAAYGLLVNTIP